jgi:hypothetical protein
MSISILLSAALMASTAMAAENPVIISDFTTGPSSRVRISNTAHQPVTAWSIATTTPTATGTHREVYTTEGYLSEVTHGLPKAAERLERLMPGESRDLPLDPLPEGTKVKVIAAVLDDGTAIGDESALASIFANRVKERDALKSVVDAFDAVLPAYHGPQALAALQDRLSALVDRTDSVPCRTALEAVQTYQTQSQPDRIDKSLRTYADFVNREYQLAAKHSQRREVATTSR